MVDFATKIPDKYKRRSGITPQRRFNQLAYSDTSAPKATDANLLFTESDRETNTTGRFAPAISPAP